MSRLVSLVQIPEGETIVGMCTWQGMVIIATSGGLYRLEGDQLTPIPFVPASAFEVTLDPFKKAKT